MKSQSQKVTTGEEMEKPNNSHTAQGTLNQASLVVEPIQFLLIISSSFKMICGPILLPITEALPRGWAFSSPPLLYCFQDKHLLYARLSPSHCIAQADGRLGVFPSLPYRDVPPCPVVCLFEG